MKAGPGDALLYGDGCPEYDHCLTCVLPECIYEHSKEYRKRSPAMAIENGQVDKLRDDPRCTVPCCPDEAKVYAWNDAERVLHGYCDRHREYAQDRYYHEWKWL